MIRYFGKQQTHRTVSPYSAELSLQVLLENTCVCVSFDLDFKLLVFFKESSKISGLISNTIQNETNKY